MTYYKAVQIAEKPYIQWHSFANSEAELKALNLQNDPLIIAENNIPDYQFGVCPMKIEGGQLVNRTQQEMEDFEAEYIASSIFREFPKKIADVNKGLFEFAGHSFPMHEAARLFYSCIERTPANYKVCHSSGTYILDAADIPAFLDAYYNELKTLTQVI